MDFADLSKYDDLCSDVFLDALFLWFKTSKMNSDHRRPRIPSHKVLDIIQRRVQQERNPNEAIAELLTYVSLFIIINKGCGPVVGWCVCVYFVWRCNPLPRLCSLLRRVCVCVRALVHSVCVCESMLSGKKNIATFFFLGAVHATHTHTHTHACFFFIASFF
ncbi:hypothetical protein BDB00DRAFT_612074 [Zychaea mexicana]|uniref:uncharacterized protein n=1 Tax=Zychaea mexicana TaxID=64656 RepID=UPI0022FEF5BA|nr:uncharacterized protein BDB00DRAFT_612074 [Zychaea mexicana]KAI9489533.1 hypothetical protein BDB00DRAFT_612074 [Zychaea mexicana]